MGNADEHTLLLGEIKGKLDLVIQNQGDQNTKIDGLDARLRKVETKAALNGAISGGVVGIAIALAQEKLKTVFGIG